MEHATAVIVLDDEHAILDMVLHSLAPAAWRIGDAARRAPCAVSVTEGELAGVSFLVATRGKDAEALARAHLSAGGRLAGGFFDLHLAEGIQGPCAMRAIRDLQPGLHCTVITGMPGQLDEVAAIFAPAHHDEWDYVSKPFTRLEILQRCRQMIAAAWRRWREAAQLQEIRRLNKELELWGLSLEERVHERTQQLAEAMKDLRAKNAELEEVLGVLHETQADLVQSEKMATIGQLAAGVARELSRPLAFTQQSLAGISSISERLGGFVEATGTLSSPRPETCDEATALRRSFAELCEAWRPAAARSEMDGLIAGAAEGLNRARSIVRELSAFAMSPSGVVQPVDVQRTLASAIDFARGSLAHSECLQVEIDELPAVEGSASELQHAWLQILWNAIEATSSRAGDARISVRALRTDDEVVVEICDNGDGIPAELRERVFEPFFSTRGRRPGLGLSVVHGVVSRHGGRVVIEDAVPSGTLVRVILPASAVASLKAC